MGERRGCLQFANPPAASTPGLEQVWEGGEYQAYEANTADKSENELHVRGILSIIFQE
jgi:hypothetical protein